MYNLEHVVLLIGEANAQIWQKQEKYKNGRPLEPK